MTNNSSMMRGLVSATNAPAFARRPERGEALTGLRIVDDTTWKGRSGPRSEANAPRALPTECTDRGSRRSVWDVGRASEFRIGPSRYHKITLAAVAALAIIVVTGAAVRLTGSGLGCTDWPNCTDDRLVAPLEFHPMVEFVNRLFTGVVSVAVAAAVLGAYRRTPFRADLVRWSWGLVAGVVAQIVWGGLTVWSHLHPAVVSGHFLISMVLMWNAVTLAHRAGIADNAVGRPPLGDRERARRHPDRRMGRGGPDLRPTRHRNGTTRR